jgi:predicted PurR-regulated permease PerM
LLVTAISAAFVAMIRAFLLTILLAAIVAGLSYPVYEWIWRGIALALFCALIVGSVDNVLRPRLVGQDTKMHELLIFFSTLGGLMFFGAMGFILGPILAALLVTAWEMFGIAFRTALAEPGSAAADADSRPPL